MQFIADLHIHSKYSRATSREMDVDNLNKWAKIKGIKVVATGDFTHPLWLKELKEKLEPAEGGLFKLKKKKTKARNDNWLPNGNKDKDDGTRFILSSEISCIFSKNNKTRKVHLLVYAPDFKTVEKINTQLGWQGNIKADGRPILGMDIKEVAKIALNSSAQCMIIPAHMWTPWFSLFGSNSGFDTLEECFDDYTKYIHAGETGLSSDPAMNWRWSALDNVTLISNSDAHSPNKLGREANVFEMDRLSYRNIADAIKNGADAKDNGNKLVSTIEFYPEEGKYHFNGHRSCRISLTPHQTKKVNNICPSCGKPLTIGVLHRVDELADRQEGGKPEKTIPYCNLIPLDEIIADSLGMGVATKRVKEEYKNLIKHFGTEFAILRDASQVQIEQASSPEIGEGVIRARQGKVHIEPGYDGQFGQIKIFYEEERGNLSKQTSLF